MALPTSNHCGTNLIYRGIAFRNCELKQHEQNLIYDQSNTDVMYSEYTFTVTGKIHKDDGLLRDGDVGGERHPILGVDAQGVATLPNAVDTKKRLESHLMQPRGELEIWVGGERLVQVLQSTNKSDVFNNPQLYDCDNGPKPVSCQITDVIGLQHFHVEFTIKCCLNLCDPNNLPVDLNLLEDQATNFEWAKDAPQQFGVLNNRWSMVESRDKEFKLRRTIAGKLRVRHASYIPMTMVYLCLPPLPRDMQRVTQEFTTSPNGLELTYRVTDVQRISAAPHPAIDWSGTHKERVDKFGTHCTTDIQVSVVGAPGSSKEALFFAALELISRRIGDVRNSSGQFNSIATSFTLIDVMNDNKLSLSASVMRSIRDPTGGAPGEESSTDGDSPDQLKLGGIPYRHLGRLPAVHSAPPVFSQLADYLQGAIVTFDGDIYKAKKYVKSGAAFNADEWEDITGEIVDRDDRNGVYNDPWPQPQAYDPNSNLGQFASYFQNPCILTHGFPSATGTVGSVNESPPTNFDEWAEQQTNNAAQNDPVNATYATTNDYEPVISPNLFDNIASEHVDNIYTHLEVELKYKSKTGFIGLPKSLPIGNPSTAGTADDAADRLTKTPNPGDVYLQDDNQRYYEYLGGGATNPLNWRDYFATTAICQIHAGTQERTLFFKASRYAERPDVPSLDQSLLDPNSILEVLTEYEISPAAPQLTAGASNYLWDVEGWFKYILERPINKTTESFRVPSLPWDVTTLTANALQYATYESDEIA